MMNKLKNVIALYVHNTGFKMLTLILIFSAFESKWLYRHHNILAEDIFSLLFVICIWFLFHVGLLVKSQFAHSRASLMPGYRKVHIVGIGCIVTFFIMVLALWAQGFHYHAIVSFKGLTGVYLTVALAGILLLILGYLSISRLLLYGYVVLLVSSMFTGDIIGVLNSVSWLNIGLVLILAVLAIGFVWRLLVLKEDDCEYFYIIAWPSKKILVNQMKKLSAFSFFDLPIFSLLKPKVHKGLRIKSYPKSLNIFLRAFHWEKSQSTNWVGLIIQMSLMIGVYCVLLKTTDIFRLIPTKVYFNFLLFTITPVIFTLGSQYKQMLYWSYDLLKPISRERFIAEKMIIFLVQLFGFWAFVSFMFGYLPVKLLTPFLLDGKFVAYFAVTGFFTFFTLAVIAYLSTIQRSSLVIVLGFAYINIALVVSVFVILLTVKQLVLSSLIFLVIGGVLSSSAYRKWINKEFV